MPRKATFALATLLAALFALPAVAHADNCGYTGSGNWSASGGWTCGHVPGGADDVTIASGDTVTLDQNASAATLTLESGGTLQLGSTRTLTVSGATTLRQGTISGSGTLAASGTLTKTTASQLRIEGGTVAVGAASTWNGGDICIITGGVLRLDATLTIATGAGSFVCNSGNGQVQVGPSGRLLKDSTGTTTVSTLLDNDGTVQAAQGTLSLSAAPALATDAGLFTADAGAELTFAGIRTLSPAGRIGGAGTARFTANVTLPEGATLDPAALTLDSGTLTLDGAAPATTLPLVTLSGGTFSGARNRSIGTLNVTSGTLSGSHTATVTGAFTKTTGGQLRLEDSVSFRPQIDSTWTGGDICVINSAVFRIEATFTIGSGAGNFVCNSGNGQVQVAAGGRLRKTSGGTSTVSTLLENDGIVQASSGTLTVSGAPAVSTDAGTFLADAGAELTLQGIRTLTATGRIGGTGTARINSTVTLPGGATLDPAALTLDSGTLTLDGAGPATTLPLVTLSGGTFSGARNRSIGTLNATSGTLSGSHTATVTGAFAKATGGQLRLEDSVSFRPQIDSTWTGGDICVINSAVFRIEATFTIGSGAGNFVCNSGNGQVQVAAGGRLRKTSGGTSTVSTLLDNDGTVQASSGVLSLSAGTGTDAGTFLADSEIAFSGVRTLAATGRIGGAGLARTNANVTLPGGATLDPAALTVDSGTLTLDGTTPATTLPLVTLSGGTFAGSRDRTITTLNTESGTLSGNHVVTVTGTMTKSTTGQLRFEDSVSVRPQLDTTWTGGDICIIGAAALRITATWTIGTGAGGFVCNSGNGEIQIVAGGRLQKTPAGATTIATRTFNAGSITVGAGQTLDFTGGLTVQPGGTLTGSGTAGGTITNAGGTVSPAAGTFTLGTLTQSSGLTDVAAGETLAITGAHNQSGGTTPVEGALTAGSHAISGGSMTVIGTAGGAVTLTGTGVLAGNGQINGNVTNTSGSVRPGNSPGHLTVAGNFVQSAGGTLQIEVDGTAAFDQLEVTGVASFAGTLAIVNTFTPANTDTFQIVTSASRNGTFAIVTGAGPYVVSYPGGPAFGARLTVSGVPGPIAGTPQVTGTMQVGQTVTCNPGTWGNNPTFTFEWLRDGQPIATGNTYVLTGNDATHAISCRVTGTNGGGSATATSAPRNVPAVGPQNTAPPAISGTQTLTCDTGAWTGIPAPGLTIEWLRDGQPIATGATYDVTPSDSGHALTCRVTATNAGGSATATSAAFTPPAPQPTVVPTPKPTVTPTATPPLQNATPTQVATAFGLPPARRCVSRRNFPIRLKEPRGIKIKAAKVKVNGRKVGVRKRAGRWRAQVDLRGFPKGRFVVDIQIKTKDGRTLKGQRAYLTCTPKKKA
ncbi:MAG TPA: hypothetical protein VFZ00_00010 [Solirubrobacter sp.]|nr:hypothetical protein [Solirubrobacter sp.]